MASPDERSSLPPSEGAPLSWSLRDVLVRGVRVRFTDAGQGDAVVLLHGCPSSRRAWEELAPAIAAHRHVVAVDLPGFGDSEKPHPERFRYDVEAFAGCVMDLVCALGEGRVTLVGHDIGAHVAILLAAEHPHLVDKLVLLSPTPYSRVRTPVDRVATTPVLGSLFVKQLGGRVLFRNLVRSTLYSGWEGVTDERIDALYKEWTPPQAREAALATARATLDTRAIVARIPRVAAETLIVWGRNDVLGTVVDARRLSRELPNARLEVVDTGHSPQEEQPEAIVRLVTSFLTRKKK